MIKFENVSFRYSDESGGVSNISFTVHNQECVVLTGPSGGGKTTITRLMNGLAPTYYPGTFSGTISIDENGQLPQYAIGRKIGSVFQNPKNQFFSSNMLEELAFSCENYGVPRENMEKQVKRAMQSFGLEGFSDRSLDVLSAGEKQRVALASVYALLPDTFVFDEPTANLDRDGAERLGDALAALKRQQKTLVVAEHRLSWLRNIADRYLYVRNGNIEWEKTPAEMDAMTPEERKIYGLREVVESPEINLISPHGTGHGLDLVDISYEKQDRSILNRVCLSLDPGKITALTGRNGTGKSVLCQIIAGLRSAKFGSITLDGRPFRRHRRKKAIWYGPYDAGSQFFTNSVREELQLIGGPETVSSEETKNLLRDLGLYDLQDVHPASLSGGQKQRLAIACGILSGRRILIFDEPTCGLDGASMQAVAKIFRTEAAKKKTLLIVTHDQELMALCCDNRIHLS